MFTLSSRTAHFISNFMAWCLIQIFKSGTCVYLAFLQINTNTVTANITTSVLGNSITFELGQNAVVI